LYDSAIINTYNYVESTRASPFCSSSFSKFKHNREYRKECTPTILTPFKTTICNRGRRHENPHMAHHFGLLQQSAIIRYLINRKWLLTILETKLRPRSRSLHGWVLVKNQLSASNLLIVSSDDRKRTRELFGVPYIEVWVLLVTVLSYHPIASQKFHLLTSSYRGLCFNLWILWWESTKVQVIAPSKIASFSTYEWQIMLRSVFLVVLYRVGKSYFLVSYIYN
jgi:hypothetical protein